MTDRPPDAPVPPPDAPAARRRTHRSAYVVLLALLGVFGALFAMFAPTGQAAGTTNASANDVSAGRQLFLVSCSTCHGENAQGSSAAPSLIGVGSAAVDFQMSTGRMPAATYQIAEEPRKEPKFSQSQIYQIAAYIQSLAPGPQIPTNLNYQAADEAFGGNLFRTECAACHNFQGSGGELAYGTYAPSLHDSTPRQIYEAMLTGPENMPVFGDGVITPQEKLDIIKYIVNVHAEADPGGDGIGRIGPVPEGLVAWVLGIGVLVGVTIWIGARA